QQPRVCTCHYIREKSLVNVVRSILKVTMEYVNFDTEAFAKGMMEKSQKDKLAEIARNKRSLAQKRTRIEELDKLFERIYEDNVVGKLSDERFAKMSAKYEGEQKSLLEEVNALEISITDNENQLGGVDKFIELTKQHLEFREVTPALINAFIDKIIVHEPEKKRGANRNQFVEVIFNFVGPVEID
ncbi:MAG: DUF4368 domain-containing protein, partial [Defluviitaleaceae bacterium]|nr:DUF4368 domain-containing protein [Defluviitaleaceae bacterium]